MNNYWCHCGWGTFVADGIAMADPPQCPLCECYTFCEREKGTFWDSDKNCVVKKQKERYPYLESVVSYIESLPHRHIDFYVRHKVGKQFNLTPEEVCGVLDEIEEMKEYAKR